MRPGHDTGPPLNGTRPQSASARPSSHASGVNASANGRRSASRWKNALSTTNPVPAGKVRAPQRTGAVASRRIASVVGHSRTDSSTHPRAYGRTAGPSPAVAGSASSRSRTAGRAAATASARNVAAPAASNAKSQCGICRRTASAPPVSRPRAARVPGSATATCSAIRRSRAARSQGRRGRNHDQFPSRRSASRIATSRSSSRAARPRTTVRTVRHHDAANVSQSSRPDASTVATSARVSRSTAATNASPSRCTGSDMSSTASLYGRRTSRSGSGEISTPSGWKWASAPRFSQDAGVKGSGDPARMRSTCSGRVASTSRRPPRRTTSGAPSYRARSRSRTRRDVRSTWRRSAQAVARGRRTMAPWATSGPSTSRRTRPVSLAVRSTGVSVTRPSSWWASRDRSPGAPATARWRGPRPRSPRAGRCPHR